MRKKIKNTFLKGFTAVMCIIWALSILGADSNPDLAIVTLTISTAWLTYFGWCNGWVNFGGVKDADFQK